MDGANGDRLETLLAWQRELDQELEGLRAKQTELSKSIGLREAQSRNLRELLQIEQQSGQDSPPVNGSETDSLADAAYEAVKEIGEPVYYKDLAEHLVGIGVAIPGRDPKANLLSYIARDERFKRIKRGTYALAEWNIRARGRRSQGMRRASQ